MGNAADALGAVHQHHAVRLHAQGKGVFHGKMETAAVSSDEQHVYQVFNNLAEGQGHNRQIIAPQPQHRDTDEHAEEGCRKSADNQGQNKPQQAVGNGILHTFGKEGAGKGSHAHKSRMAQAQLSQHAYHQVQGDCQNYIVAEGYQQSLQGTGDISRTDHDLHHRKGRDHDSVGDPVLPRCL